MDRQIVIVGLLLLVLITPIFAADFENGDFETGDFTNWTTDTGGVGTCTITTDPSSPEHGYVAQLNVASGSIYNAYCSLEHAANTKENPIVAFSYKVINGVPDDNYSNFDMDTRYEGGYVVPAVDITTEDGWTDAVMYPDPAYGEDAGARLDTVDVTYGKSYPADRHQTILLDDFEFLPVDGCGGITNGDFETGDFSNWTLEEGGGIATIGSDDFTYYAILSVNGNDGFPFVRLTTENIVDTRSALTISFNYTVLSGTPDGFLTVNDGEEEEADSFIIECGEATGRVSFSETITYHTLPTSISIMAHAGSGVLQVLIDDINISCEEETCDWECMEIPSNGDFETGDFTDWDTYGVGTGSATVEIPDGETSYVANLSVVETDFDSIYMVQHVTLGGADGVSFRYKIVETDGAENPISVVVYYGGEFVEGFVIDTPTTTDWIVFDGLLENHEVEADFGIRIDQSTCTMYIDDICFYQCAELPCGGLTNGDFETGDATGWGTDFHSGNGSYDINESYAAGGDYGAFLFVDTPTDFSGLYQGIDFTGIEYIYVTYKVIAADGFTGFDVLLYDTEFGDFYTLYSDYEVGDWRTVAVEIPWWAEEVVEPLLIFSTGYSLDDGGGGGEYYDPDYPLAYGVYIDNITCIRPDLPTPDCSLTNGDFEAEYTEENPIPGWTQDGQQVAWWHASHSYSYGFQSIYADVAVNGELVPFFELTQSANFDDRTNLTFAYIAWFTDDFTVETPETIDNDPLSNMSVFVDDDLIFFTNESTVDYGDALEWVVEDIDISGYGYTGNHTVKIELNVNYSMNYESIFEIDNICLYSPASTCAPITGPITGNESTYENITFTGSCGTCENEYTYHFEYSATTDGFTMYTEPLTLPSSATPDDSVEILSPYFPYIDGQTYYYRLARDDGEVGETLTFQVGAYSVTPVPTTTYTEEHFEPFVEAEWDLAELATVVPVPYFTHFGYILWAIFWGAILMAFWVRQEDVTIPAFMYLIVFFTLDLADVLPSSFVVVSWVFAGICLGAILYTLFRGRKHG